ncbi:MMPL family transporter [Streptosporangium sp. NPDC023963]|uniref:MMPL family transporter n=1 Tax=Streptosporangium sp. NPDC023963 TaxID=3155608 RepID=UPI0034418D8E
MNHLDDRFTARLGRFVLRHKLVVVLAWLTVTVAGVFATVAVGDRLTEDFAQPGQLGYEANQAMHRLYGTGGDDPPLVVVVTLPEGGTAARQRAEIGRLFSAAVSAMDVRVVSYADTADPRFVGDDGRTTYGLVFTEPTRGMNADLSEPLEKALRPALMPGATLRVTGMEALAEAEAKGVDVLAETLIGGVGALVVLAFVFGSVLALVPLLVAAVSIPVTFLAVYGLTGVTDVHTIVQFIVSLVGLGVAIDYSLLLITRWREERALGYEGEAAVERAMATAGRSVVVSGVTVGIGLLAMVVIPVPFLRSVGYGGIMVPLVSVPAVLTLLPVLLAKGGARLDWPRRRLPAETGRWQAWARGVVRFRWAGLAASGALLAALGYAAFSLQLGQPVSDSLPRTGPAYEGLSELRRAGIPSGVLTPLDVILPPGDDPAVRAARLAELPGVRTAVAPPGWRSGGTSLITVVPSDETGTEAGRATIARVRAAVPAGAQVSGEGPQSLDFVAAVYGGFPAVLALISVLTFLLLVRAFRSLLLAVKAIVLNVLPLGATMGAVVLVWQYGYGSEPIWGLAGTGSIAEFIPVMIFAFLYGLSMDYEVFILARMREAYDRTGSTDEAVVEGLGRTGRLVTSAALILFLAFGSLAAAPQPEIKMFATGLGLGVLLDATVIRALLLPAFVAVMGRWNWWLPGRPALLVRVLAGRRPDIPVPVRTPGPQPEPDPAGQGRRVHE